MQVGQHAICDTEYVTFCSRINFVLALMFLSPSQDFLFILEEREIQAQMINLIIAVIP
jgi:hypothetical protein